MKDFFELAQITKPQGIKGEVKLEVYTDSLERFDYLEFVYFKENNEYIKTKIEKKRVDSKYAYIKFEGVDTRDDAEKLRQKFLYIDRENAAELKKGYFYIRDLIGLKVVDEHSNVIGVLTNILNTGSKDIYTVEITKKQELLFAAVDGVIISKDLKLGVITIDSKKLDEVGIYNDL